MSEQKKRYIISFVDENITASSAAGILGVPSDDIQDGISLLSTDKPEQMEDVLHFDEIGASVKAMTEDEARDFEKNDQVADVQEDIEVLALGDCCDDHEGDDFDEYDESGFEYDEDQDLFLAGYEQAIEDIYGEEVSEAGSSRQASPVRPITRRPPLTLRCPTGYRRVSRCVPIRRPLQPIPWNIRMVKANQVWRRVTGRGVKVAIIDTGIDNNHPDLSIAGGACFVPGVGPWDDDNGHGTHCAGITGARNNYTGVVGVAPNSSLYAVKVLNGAGSGQLSWILAGMNWALRNKMDVASMSLGSVASSANMACILAYQRAAQRLLNAGCIVVAAAGNSGHTQRPWVGQPARCSGFMAVAAVDKNKKIAYFSSRGPSSLGSQNGVEIAAPGVSINSTWNDGKYKSISGTSMACPHVSGAAALLKELHPTWSPARIRRRLAVTATDLGAPGNDSTFGAGLLDCWKAVFG